MSQANSQATTLLPVLIFIQSHLADGLVLEKLAEKAALSPYHFHRLFHQVIGETPKQYTQRLRLERAAFLLKIQDATILEIALNVGYAAPETFTRAFKRWFGVTPKQFRQSYGRSVQESLRSQANLLNKLTTETSYSRLAIQKLKPIPVAFIRSLGAYVDVDAQAYDTLITWADTNGLYTGDNLLLGVGHDDPSITPKDKVRFDACLSVPEAFQPEGKIGFQTLPGGHYATITYIGPWGSGLEQAYAELFRQLVERKNLEIIGLPALEIYRTTQINPDYALNMTDIYIPVRKVGE